MNEIVTKKDPAVLAIEIRSIQQQAQVVVLSYAIEIGRRLCEAKAVVPHGQWGEWLANEVEFSQSSALNYMKIYERYGSEQLSLFGDAKSQTLGNLPYTKALKLLAVPENEVDEFLEENDVESMSTRELAQAIKERDEARDALSAAEKEREQAKAQADNAAASAVKAQAEADRLRAELKELHDRPVEVAVEAPSEEMLEEIRAAEAEKFRQERERLEKQLADAEAKAQKQAEKAKKLKADADAASAQAKAEAQKELDAAAQAKAAAEAVAKEQEARATELEKKLKLADSSAAIFQVYFASVQEDCNRMLGLIQKAEETQADKYRAALRALLERVGGMLQK